MFQKKLLKSTHCFSEVNENPSIHFWNFAEHNLGIHFKKCTKSAQGGSCAPNWSHQKIKSSKNLKSPEKIIRSVGLFNENQCKHKACQNKNDAYQLFQAYEVYRQV